MCSALNLFFPTKLDVFSIIIMESMKRIKQSFAYFQTAIISS
jgi:hypothetical protein